MKKINNIKEKIISFLTKECDVPLQKIKDNPNILLLSGGILDSLSIFKLASFLEAEFVIKLDPEHIHPDNIDTIDNIVSMILFIKSTSKQK